jgi:hypothetical protein
MNVPVLAAYIAAVILGLVIVLQVLLAAGLPLGRMAWGGKHRVLPAKLRLSSLFAIVILAVAGWVVLARAGLVQPGPETGIVRIMIWVYGAYFALNTLGNLTSKSDLERRVMSPATIVLSLCFLLVALS